MKVKLTAGAELDLLSPGELRDGLNRELRAWSGELLRGARLIRRSLAGTVAADGTLTLGSVGDPVGPEASMVWGITRLTVTGAGDPVPVLVTNVDPAAGAQYTVTVPQGQTWRLRTFHMLLTTSAVVANRIVELYANDGANTWFRSSINNNVAASSTKAVVFIPSATNNGSGALNSPLPGDGLILPAGYRLFTNVTNLDVADQISAVRYTYDNLAGGSGIAAYANSDDPGSVLAELAAGTNIFDARAMVLNGGERLVIAGTGLTPGANVTVTAQIREVPAPMAWSL